MALVPNPLPSETRRDPRAVPGPVAMPPASRLPWSGSYPRGGGETTVRSLKGDLGRRCGQVGIRASVSGPRQRHPPASRVRSGAKALSPLDVRVTLPEILSQHDGLSIGVQPLSQ